MLDRVACEPPQKYPPKCFVRKLFTLLGKFSILGGLVFSTFGGSKNNFNPCHHIEFNTQNPNPILKITIPFTKTPKKPKHFRKRRNILDVFGFSKNPKFSKTQTFILHSVYVPQFIFSYIYIIIFRFLWFLYFWKMEIFKNPKISKKTICYLVLCIRSIIHNFFIFFIILYIYISINLHFYIFVFLYN